jgi:transposase
MSRPKTKHKTRHVLDTRVHPDAAGIDLGAEELVAAVPADRDARPVRTFGTFTTDLHALRDWLVARGITTVAMESTGNYWIAPYQILEDAGIRVFLVNARHVKAVPGKKTDVCDAQWLQHLHTAGLLKGSFRPDKEIVPLRYLMRHRARLVESASQSILHMQKVLTEMNIKLHHVFSDLDGASAMRVIEAILGGEREPRVLWGLRDRRCKSTWEKFAAAVRGDWRDEYLFVLGQCVERWRETHRHITACDDQLGQLIGKVTATAGGPTPEIKEKRRGKNGFSCSIREEAWRFYGVDLGTIDGVSTGTLAVLMSELGTGGKILESFRSGAAFASWLGLCPNNTVTGGRIIQAKTRKVANRVAKALRLAVLGINHSKGELGHYLRRMKARLGKAEGITAAAHKLARIIYAMIRSRQSYDEKTACHSSPQTLQRRLKNLQATAAKLGFTLVTNQQLA